MKIVTIVGARPQFIKAAPVSRAIAGKNKRVTNESLLIKEVIVHTGQHYDDELSAVFFRDLDIPEPEINLEIGSGTHGRQTGQMLIRLEEVLLAEAPDWVLVYGDTNSTLAGALAAVKLNIPVVHIEAGLRCFNREMPEEHNRILADHMSTLLFCPTETAVKNLEREGITQGVHLVGDVMYDSVLHYLRLAEKESRILEKLQLKPKAYALATVHRAENTDEFERLNSIFNALSTIAENGLSVIAPLHPRTKKALASNYPIASTPHRSIKVIDPISYLDMLLLEKQAQLILTDSGGVQKEAYWLEVPCVTLRDETEWVETVETGWNMLAGWQFGRIVSCANNARSGRNSICFGNGRAAKEIVMILHRYHCRRQPNK